MIEDFAYALAESRAQELAVFLLGNVPGLPPITQSLHILGIAAVTGSSLMLNLRILGVAVPSQNVSEMIRRLMPWTWSALLVNALTGSLFVIARPLRYYFNPVFAIKFSLLVPALVLAFIIHRQSRTEAGYWERSPMRRIALGVIAAVSLVLWVGVVLAGRWIAYSEYLFFPE
jgi:hypothetical protein